jgi:hypothetical protein
MMKGMQTKKSMHPIKLNTYFVIKLNRVELWRCVIILDARKIFLKYSYTK